MTSTMAASANGTQTVSTSMRVRKRNGSLEEADVSKIVRAVGRSSEQLNAVDPLRVATKTINGLYDGTTTRELDELSIRTAASLITEEPQYSKLAARLLCVYIDKEIQNQDIQSYSQSVKLGHYVGLISDDVARFVATNARKLNETIDIKSNLGFEYFGIRTLYDRYLLKHPESRLVIETPQYFFMRVACGLATSTAEAVELYRLMSSLDYMPSSPTLFNSGTRHPQMSSCYVLDSPDDDLESIYNRYTDIAKLSKFSGGIGVSFSRVRSNGSSIRGTNGTSNGLIPWLKTLDSSVAAVNQGGKRKGAACVYVETWHADIESYLELRNNSGKEEQRTHNLNIANWVPDLFMRRVKSGEMWSLFDPKVVPYLVDTYGEEFERLYAKAEDEGLYVRQISAQNLYKAMMRTLAHTGNGWMTFKDSSNRKSNQTLRRDNVIHLSNLCTEIMEVTSNEETAVCNLGSINLGHFVVDGRVDYERLRDVAGKATRYLDRVVDINYYPTETARVSNRRWRPVGLGVMGWQDVLFKLRIPFDSPDAMEIAARIQEEIYYAALDTSCKLAEEHSAHATFNDTRASNGELQFDLWGVVPSKPEWGELKERIVKHGLRNSLLIAIAPTATIASIAGAYECIEPQVSNFLKRETLSGDFLQVNPYLVADLKDLGLWNDDIVASIKREDGSIQGIHDIPSSIKMLYRTAWELSQRTLIDLAVARGRYIDQSQALSLFMAAPTIDKLSAMYYYAWESDLKTTYYLRSRPATRIMQATTTPTASDDALACSLENPESCEACQ